VRKFGRLAQDCVPQLIALLDDPNALARDAAAEALSGMGSTSAVIPMVQASLKDALSPMIAEASRTIKIVGPPAVIALPYIIEALQSEDGTRRRQALALVEALGPQAAPALGILIDMALNSDDLPFMLERALIAVGGDQQPMVEVLHERLHSSDNTLVRATLSRITSIGVPCSPLIDDIITVMHDLPLYARGPALSALASMKAAAVPAMPAIEAALTEPETQVSALNAIATMKQPVLSLVESIIPLIDAEKAYVRNAALSALKAIAPPATPGLLEKILQQLDDDDQWVRYWAFDTATHLQPLATETARRLLPILVSHRDDSNYFVSFLRPYQDIVDAGLPAGIVL
jgi:HEAT repeat protein